VRRKDIKPSDDVAVYDEVSILASLINPYIVPLIDFFEGKGCYYIIMELMAGGDLFDRISLRTTYSEKDARDLFRKMLDALKY
jgi:serine/threonine protein kinase